MIASDIEKVANKPNLTNRPEWRIARVADAKAPSELTVTHVNQTYDLLKEAERYSATGQAEEQDSEEWLQTHNIHHLRLTLKDLVDKGTIGKPVCDKSTGRVQQHIQFDAATINEFEFKLQKLIRSYTERIKFCLAGSKRTFGLIKGSSVAVIVDTSDVNTGHLIDEQLKKKDKLYFVSFGTNIDPLWQVPRDVNCRIVEEAEQWVRQLQPSGGCNLLKSLKHVLNVKGIDQVIIILGSVPDQKSEVMCDYVYQLLCGREKPIHCIAYDCNNEQANSLMKNLADISGGRFHCYTSTNEEQIYTGDDISRLLDEVKEAQNIINKIKDMRRGLLGSALVSIMDEISNEVAKLPQSRFLPRPPGHDLPLNLDQPTFHPKTSKDWIKSNGLKAKNLEIYQVLAKNSHTFKEDFVPVLKRTVKSQVNNSALTKFTWNDGSIRNVHVDMSEMFEYQKHLGDTVKVFEDRVNWLSQGSKRIFGTVTEKIVVIIVDLSLTNLNYLVHIQHSMRLLLEQQLVNKDYINIITYGMNIKKWKPTLTKVTPQSLQDAWKFCLDMQCEGSRNFLEAFRQACENDDETHHNVNVEGIYLFTSGVPDQHGDVCLSYVEESLKGRGCKLHTVLFNVDDYDSNGAIPGRYSNITVTSDLFRTMAHVTGGRFHWFRETGIIESDDIKEITNEIDRAVTFSNQASSLVETVKSRYKDKSGTSQKHSHGFHKNCIPTKALLWPDWPLAPEAPALNTPPSSNSMALVPVNQRQLADRSQETPNTIRRPQSAKSNTSRSIAGQSTKSRTTSAKESSRINDNPMAKVKNNFKKKQPATQVFYTGDKSQPIGVVFKDYPLNKSVRKDIVPASIPHTEETISTKDWMKKYSINKLRLDLYKLVSGPDCKHVDQSISALGKSVGAKYCNIFPSVNVKGTIKHLQLLPHELERYEVQMDTILKRYIRRLQWLLSGSRRVFGTIVEQKVAILVDISGSMMSHMDELKHELASLIWDQLYPQKVRFNMIGFSKNVSKWMSKIALADEEKCHEAIEWISRLSADGNTCTLQAIQTAFCDLELDAIYLLSDGKPDTSTQHVLKEVARMNEHRQLRIHTMSFHCDDKSANSFLRMLAAETGGRYHRSHGPDFNADLFAHKVLNEGFTDETVSIPEFEGDDLRRLAAEIALARQYLNQAKLFREQYNTKKSGTDDNTVGRIVSSTVKV
ncbi:VWA3A [Bugula neritina]|uniref:VWA3A n=2 Tax=Bugula neritina TaxID=10212 RepID=A0A7J7J2Q1_BUGNE|nr:VWA3A [Bugula neritina]